MNGMKSAYIGASIALFGIICLAAHAQAPIDGATPKTAASTTSKTAEVGNPATRTAESKSNQAESELCRCVGQGDAAAAKNIEKVLAAPLRSSGLDYSDQPLQDVVSNLQEEYGIPIQLNKAALEDAGIATDSPVSVTLHNISLRSALKLMLRHSQLTWVIRDEVLMITTPADADKDLVTCVYNVHGLVDDANPQSMKSLIDAIEACVATESWSDNGGGESDIMPLPPGLLVVSQTSTIQQEVNGLLAKIRKMREQVPVTKSGSRSAEPSATKSPSKPAEQSEKAARPATAGGEDPFGN